MINEIVTSPNAPEPVGAYPHARRIGDFLFLSGVGPRQVGTDDIPGVTLSDSGEILDYDIELQTRSVLDNVESVLQAAGLGLEHLADVSVFLTNMKDDFPTYNRVYAEYLSAYKPCRTTVEVVSLPTPIAIELKCIAVFSTE